MDQIRLLEQTAGATRFLWNSALSLQNERKQRGAKLLSYAALCKELTAARHDPGLAWFAAIHSKAQQQKLKDLAAAFGRFFDKLKTGEVARAIAQRKAKGKRIKRLPYYPRFKKKGRGDSFRFVQDKGCIDLAGDKVKLPAFGWMRFRKSRGIEGEIRNATISREADHWYVSIQVQYEVQEPTHPATAEVGIDLGVAKFAALSTGERVLPLGSFRRHEKAIAKANQALARKRRFSRNWKKQKSRLTRLHARVAHVRRDFLQKLSTNISKSHAMIAVEDLQVKNMSASAVGSAEKPGKKVRQKRGLNRSILDQGWYEFRRQLQYKQLWRGGVVVAVTPHYTSQRCSSCGHVSGQNRWTQSEFLCVACGHQDDADINAAKNILAAGRAASACGSNSAGSRKQEPLAA